MLETRYNPRQLLFQSVLSLEFNNKLSVAISDEACAPYELAISIIDSNNEHYFVNYINNNYIISRGTNLRKSTRVIQPNNILEKNKDFLGAVRIYKKNILLGEYEVFSDFCNMFLLDPSQDT